MVLSSKTGYTGETISWKDGTARVLNHSIVTNKVLILFNGKQEWVDINDIFGINKKKEETLSGFDKRIEDSNKRIEEYTIKLDAAKEQYKLATRKIFDLKRYIQQLLGGSDVESLSAKKQEEYYAALGEIKTNNSSKFLADCSIHSYANFAVDEILYNGDLKNQEALAKTILA